MGWNMEMQWLCNLRTILMLHSFCTYSGRSPKEELSPEPSFHPCSLGCTPSSSCLPCRDSLTSGSLPDNYHPRYTAPHLHQLPPQHTNILKHLPEGWGSGGGGGVVGMGEYHQLKRNKDLFLLTVSEASPSSCRFGSIVAKSTMTRTGGGQMRFPTQ